MKTKLLYAAAAAWVVSFGLASAQSSGGLGQSAMDHGNMAQGRMDQQGSALADGEVRKVDKDAQKLTIKHGPIPSMDMPPMTMVYRVKDSGMLEQVKPGDKVRFHAENVGGAYTVMRIELAK